MHLFGCTPKHPSPSTKPFWRHWGHWGPVGLHALRSPPCLFPVPCILLARVCIAKGEKQRCRAGCSLLTQPHAPHCSLLSQSKKYVVMLVDPDAPSRANPRSRFWRHWLLTDVPVSVPRWEGGDIPTAAPTGAPFIPWVKSQRGEMQMVLGVWVGEHFLRPNTVRLGLKYCCFFFFSFPSIFFYPFLKKYRKEKKKNAACKLLTHSSICTPSRESSHQLIWERKGEKNISFGENLERRGKKTQQFWCRIPYFSFGFSTTRRMGTLPSPLCFLRALGESVLSTPPLIS